MNSKLNIEEIQLLIPDYISGELSDSERSLVESALSESAELNEFYIEMKETLNFVSSVKFTEPAPQYWNTLLPRIHEKIENRQSKGFSWDNVTALWKVLVPVAAVILIALVYFLVKPSATQLTEEKKIEKITNDTSGDNNNVKEDKQEENQEDRKDEKSIVNEQKKESVNDAAENRSYIIKKYWVRYYDEIVKDETANNVTDRSYKNMKIEQIVLDDDIEGTSIFVTDENSGLDDETINELKKLDDNERSLLLEELVNSNL
ncbi:MAG: zf-HC2 domain-containing protein [Ignavibacteria bacterium]|nr:zf-HC2 domain-containing protein [Ignavibacteria bacterium]